MKILLSHFLLLLYCFGCFFFQTVSWQSVGSFLCAITAATLFYTFQNRTFSIIFLCIYGVTAFFIPALYLFLPLLFYEIGRLKSYPVILIFLIGSYTHFEPSNTTFYLFCGFGCLLALFLAYLTDSYSTLEYNYKQMRDDSTERNLLLKARNQTLLENQNYEIHNATLQERNRIAREIHDNVGHLLSRCILMTGALQTINQNERCTESLHLLQDTLSQAMDNIRDSVHNLHDDSINLQKSMENLINGFTFCPIHLEYDISNDIPSAVRYAFISISKEALTNITKHSNAAFVKITLREHPAMYQLVIYDNGNTASKIISLEEINQQNCGIGLVNMYDRVKLLHGIMQITQKDGFQIFVSIPKNLFYRNEDIYENNNC